MLVKGIITDITRITAHMNSPRRWHGWGNSTTAYPSEPLPAGVNWEQWMDTVAQPHPYSKKLHPAEWRSWFDHGSGCFGDWGPHILDTSHRFLKLGLPEKITAAYRDGVNNSDLIYPDSSTIKFDFPERGAGMPACEVTWYDGVNNKPQLEAEYSEPVTNKETGEVTHGPTTLNSTGKVPGSYTHLRAHETKAKLVFRLLLEKKKKKQNNTKKTKNNKTQEKTSSK